MERHVKERLIGAAVLVAAAVILIPEMLSGPDRVAQRDVPAAVTGDAPLKTYTIDLSRSPATQVSAADSPVTEQAPPPELPAPSTSTPPATQVNPESPAPTQSQSAVAEEQGQVNAVPPPTAQADAAANRPSSTPAAKPAVEKPTPSPVSHESKPAGEGWAVQLGSFSSQATANTLAKQFRADGYQAFVMPVKSGGSTLYRVRLGPVSDRDAATRMLAKVRTKVSGAAVVHHP